MGNIQRIQTGLKKLWTSQNYSEQFRKSRSEYKHFDHTLKHIRKAAQELENLTEEADHSGFSTFEPSTVRKYVSDIVISAIRLANVAPSGVFDLEDAVFTRIERKMGPRLSREPEAEERRLQEKIAALKKALWDRVRVWNDPGDRNHMLCDLCSSPEADGHKASCVLAV